MDNTPILCIYIWSSSNNHEFFSMLVKIGKVKNVSGCLIIIDDMNINIVGIKLVDNEYLDKLSEYSFVSCINAYRDLRLIADVECDCQLK